MNVTAHYINPLHQFGRISWDLCLMDGDAIVARSPSKPIPEASASQEYLDWLADVFWDAYCTDNQIEYAPLESVGVDLPPGFELVI